MPDPELAAYQRELAELLQRVYPDVPIQAEWSSNFGTEMYCPRVDLAIGPFATTHGERSIDAYDYLMNSSQEFIFQIIQLHISNIGLINANHTREESELAISIIWDQLTHRNRNSRCFIAFEIENKVTRKHLMGGAINAAALGRIGIAVAWKPDKLKRYLDYLASVGKNTFDTANLLILDKAQLQQAVLSFVRH